MPDHFPLIEVSGSPYEMGYQHGAQAADLVKKYLTWIEKLTEMSRDILCRNAMVFLPLIKALSSDLVEEIEGLADGADTLDLTAMDIDKVLGSGRLTVALKIIVAEASAKAIEKIEAAGGSLEMEAGGEE